MKINNIFIFCFYIFSFHITSANIQICDNGNIQTDKATFSEICNGGEAFSTFSGVTHVNGTYQNILQGYLGNNMNNSLSENIEGKIYTGWFDTYKQTKITRTTPEYSRQLGYNSINSTNTLTSNIEGKSQVGFFDQHKQTKVSSTYPEYNSYLGFYGYYNTSSITLDRRPIIKPLSPILSSGSSSSNNCQPPDTVHNLSSKINTDKLYPQIDITWTGSKNTVKQKIIIYSPKIEYMDIDQYDSSYALKDIKNNTLYIGGIMSYSECGGFSYSNTFEIKTNFSKNTPLLLEYNKDIFTLQNTSGINTQKNILLTCTQNNTDIFSGFFPESAIINFKNPKGGIQFECFLKYYDKENNKHTSPHFYFETPVIKNLTAQIALGLIYNGETNANILWQDSYFLHDSLSDTLDNGDISLLLTNTYGGVYMTDAQYAFEMFQRLGLMPTESKISSPMGYLDFVPLIQFIKQKNNFQKLLVDDITHNYTITQSDIIRLTQKSHIIYNQLKSIKNTDITAYNNILNCVSLKGCQDKQTYYNFIESLEVFIPIDQKNFPYIDNSSDVTWKRYINILYTTLGYKEYVSKKYSEKEYSNFIQILERSITKGDDFYKQKMDYFDLHRINISLYSSQLPSKIEKLSEKSVKIIKEVYPKLVDKDRLFILLNDYLQK